ncbi:MAG: RIP metalloprotease RseP [Pseudomonadota bacterium]|nr:RIP metalloprotease RseP [Pseudomonadota bacterium]
MIDIAIKLGAFIVAIALLVSFHEFGHFWVARRLGVKVLRFSVGFGTPLWQRRGRDGVMYQVAALPLGGYVKMLDEREAPVPEHERAFAFNRQAPWKRFLIVLAGPAANFLLAIALYWVLLTTGITGTRPLVDAPPADTPAAVAGLRAGDEIVAVDGRQTRTWERVNMALVEAVLRDSEVELSIRRAEGEALQAALALSPEANRRRPAELLEQLGLAPYAPPLPPVIGQVLADGAAVQAGLQPGDRIVAVDGRPVADWTDWVAQVRAAAGRPLALTLERDGQRLTLTLRPDRREAEGGPVGYIGAAPAVPDDLRQRLQAEYRYGPLAALPAAVARTWEMSALTLQMLARMVVGQVGLDNISGPINIAQYAGASFLAGPMAFIAFLAVVSISLGVLNLLPIPVLDGGHLVFYLAEMIFGRPPSEQIQLLGQQVGVLALIALMGLAIFNDIARLAG